MICQTCAPHKFLLVSTGGELSVTRAQTWEGGPPSVPAEIFKLRCLSGHPEWPLHRAFTNMHLQARKSRRALECNMPCCIVQSLSLRDDFKYAHFAIKHSFVPVIVIFPSITILIKKILKISLSLASFSCPKNWQQFLYTCTSLALLCFFFRIHPQSLQFLCVDVVD
jgi:hypothetical protein